MQQKQEKKTDQAAGAALDTEKVAVSGSSALVEAHWERRRKGRGVSENESDQSIEKKEERREKREEKKEKREKARDSKREERRVKSEE